MSPGARSRSLNNVAVAGISLPELKSNPARVPGWVLEVEADQIASANENESHYTATLKLEVNNGENVDIQQAVYTKWENGKVILERYYHS